LIKYNEMTKDNNYSFAVAGAVVGAKALAGTAVGGKVIAGTTLGAKALMSTAAAGKIVGAGVASKAAAMGVAAKVVAGTKAVGATVGSTLAGTSTGAQAVYTWTSIIAGTEGALNFRERLKRQAAQRRRRQEILNRINGYNKRLAQSDLSNRSKKALERYIKSDRELLNKEKNYSMPDIVGKSQLVKYISGKHSREKREKLKSDRASLEKRLALKEKVLMALDKHSGPKSDYSELIKLTINEIREIEEKLE
jgi:hypothetical protein